MPPISPVWKANSESTKRRPGGEARASKSATIRAVERTRHRRASCHRRGGALPAASDRIAHLAAAGRGEPDAGERGSRIALRARLHGLGHADARRGRRPAATAPAGSTGSRISPGAPWRLRRRGARRQPPDRPRAPPSRDPARDARRRVAPDRRWSPGQQRAPPWYRARPRHDGSEDEIGEQQTAAAADDPLAPSRRREASGAGGPRSR